MKKTVLFLAALLTILPAHANEQLARDNQCFKCHAIDTKKKAPSFQHIARSFKDDANGSAEIEHTIRNGISSFFGADKMPRNTRMSDAEIKSVAQWILSQ